MNQLKECHDSYPWLKFAGLCNTEKGALNACLRQEVRPLSRSLALVRLDSETLTLVPFARSVSSARPRTLSSLRISGRRLSAGGRRSSRTREGGLGSVERGAGYRGASYPSLIAYDTSRRSL